MSFGLSLPQFALLEKLVLMPLKQAGARVWVFGSRATGEYHRFSDIDLLYEFPDNTNLSLIAKITEAIEESALSIEVDLVDMNHLSTTYQERIIKQLIEL